MNLRKDVAFRQFTFLGHEPGAVSGSAVSSSASRPAAGRNTSSTAPSSSKNPPPMKKVPGLEFNVLFSFSFTV